MTTVGDFFAAMTCEPLIAPHIAIGRRPLILAPHPDDESLGCGGLIAARCAAGTAPIVVILTDGTKSHPNSREYVAPRLRALREAETLEATGCLGLPRRNVVFLRQPDAAAPVSGAAFEAVVSVVATLLRDHACDALLSSWRHDPHCDHEAASLIAAAASRRAGCPHWAYPVWGRTLPQETEIGTPRGVRVDVEPFRDAKRRAIRSHRSQWAGLITDDPDGFQMRPEFMTMFDTPGEIYIEAS